MAIHAPITGAPTRAPAIPSTIAQTLSRFDRNELAGFIAVAIDLLDLADGDADLEEADLEDSFVLSRHAVGDGSPGCSISDPGGGNVDDGGEDVEEREIEEYADEFSDPLLRRSQANRIRRTRCAERRRSYRNWNGTTYTRNVGWWLYNEPTVPSRRTLFRRKRGVPRRPRA